MDIKAIEKILINKASEHYKDDYEKAFNKNFEHMGVYHRLTVMSSDAGSIRIVEINYSESSKNTYVDCVDLHQENLKVLKEFI